MQHHLVSPVRLALGGAVAMGCAMGIGRFVYTPILPFMVEALGLSASQAGIIASANFFGYLLGAVAASVRLPGPPKTWLIGALLLSAATTAGVGLCSGVLAIAAQRFLGGLASAFVLVFASSLVLQALAEAQRGGLAAVHFAGVGIGIAVSALVVVTPVGWEGMWFVSGAATLLGAVLAAWLIPGRHPVAPPTGSTRGTGAGDGSRAGRRSGALVRLILAYGLFGFGYVITATFIVAIVRGAPDLRAFEPLAWLVVGLAAAPSVLVWVKIGRAIGLERGYALSCAIEAVGVLCSLWTDVAGIVIAAILLGGTFVGITALGLEAARKDAVGNPRTALGLMTVAFSIGQIVGPSFGGYTRDLTGSYAAATITAAAALVLAAVLVLVPARSR